MGILDNLNKTLNTVGKATSTADKAMHEAAKAKQIAQKVGSAIEKKCKYCGSVLKSDAEKQKGVCVNCALSRA